MEKVQRKRVFKRRDAPESRCENFVPWVPENSEDPQDLEEEARMERSVGLLNRYAARKRKRQVSSNEESGAPPAQSIEPSPPVSDNLPTVDGSSGDRAITISGSPELRQTGESGPDGSIQPRSGIGDPTPIALQVIPPSDRGEKRTVKSQFTRLGLLKPTCPVEVLTLNYTPPYGPEPPRVEVTTPGMEEVKGLLHRWEPFHREASAADRLNNLYSHIYRVLVVSHGMGLHEDYSVNLPTSTPKEDFQQIVDDEILVWNRNFVQSTELIRHAVLQGEFFSLLLIFLAANCFPCWS